MIKIEFEILGIEKGTRNQRTKESKDQRTKEMSKSSLLSTLTHEQRAVIHHLLQGENLFLTGGGGVGKSYLLSVIYNELPTIKYEKDVLKSTGNVPRRIRIQMCALTGCAALLLGNKTKTLHSWAGIGLGKGTVQELFVKIRRNSRAMRHWLCTDLLVIDEVSMMTAELFTKLNELAKKIRCNSKPFGGIQVLLVGDFFQLPPVCKSEEGGVTFAFETDTWKDVITSTIELTILQRQKDPLFQKILSEARWGKLSDGSCSILQSRMNLDWQSNRIRPTLLFPRRSEVDLINETNLRSLTDEHYHYHTRFLFDGKLPANFTEEDPDFQKAVQRFDSESPYAIDLELALNAQVMLIANVNPDAGLVNGSRGVVVGFTGAMNLPIVEFINGAKCPIGQHSWPIEEYEFVSRSQIPLRLAYAVTIHKSQGSSLDCALIDIGSGIFEFGQSYVALSRLRSLEALYVYDFNPRAFRAHPRVKEFYQHLVVKPIPDPLPDIVDSSAASTASTAAAAEDEKEMPSLSLSFERVVHVQKVEQEAEPGQQLESNESWLWTSIPSSWKSILLPFHSHIHDIARTLESKETILPPRESIWAALDSVERNQIRMVILGQDPYPTPGNAHGFAFSVLPTVSPLPASLKNIYKELSADLPSFSLPTHGYLKKWTDQGILLLNTVLTVDAGEPLSHSKIGWESVSDHLLQNIAEHTEKVIFVLWGRTAQQKKKIIQPWVDAKGHRLFESAHPSPLSAHRGFFGSKPFSTCNQWLVEMGKDPIDWQL